MEKKKIGIGTALAIFVAIILVSSTVAVPIVNKGAVDNIAEIKQEENEKLEPRCLGFLKQLKYKWIELRSMNCWLAGDEVIDRCWEYWNDESFRTQLADFTESINTEINKLPEEHRQLAREFFDIDDAFGLNKMADRILTLRPGYILEDVQSLINPPDDYDHFNETQHDRLALYMELIYDEELGISSIDSFHPIVELLCLILAVISLTWTIPLATMLGTFGLIIANLITIVLFSPVIIPMALYVAIVEEINGDDFELGELLISIALKYGLFGLVILGIPVAILYTFNHGVSFDDGLEYVLYRIIVGYTTSEKGDSDIVTYETAPEIEHWFRRPIRAKVGESIEFCADGRDHDKVISWDGEKYRDYVQFGWDWDNDDDVDEWTNLKEQKGIAPASATVFHKFNKAGIYTVKVIARDQWGLRGDWSGTLQVTIDKKPRSACVPEFLNSFPLARLLLLLFNS